MANSRRVRTLFPVLLVAACLSLPPAAEAQLKALRRVLIFNDRGPIASPGIAVMDQAIYAGLNASPYRIDSITKAWKQRYLQMMHLNAGFATGSSKGTTSASPM